MNVTLAEYVVPLPHELDIDNVNRVEIRGVEFVPVVRCEDCKEWDEEKHWCGIRDSYGWDYKPSDYCSYGVRKAVRRCD